MAEQWEKDYLEMICEEYKKNSYDAAVEEIGGAPALIIAFDEKNAGIPKSVKISIEHIVENSCQMRIMADLFGKMDEKAFSDIERVIAHINQFLTVGNVTAFFKSRMLFYNYAFLFTKDMSSEDVTQLLASAIDIVLITAAKTIEIITPLLNGETTVQALIDSNISIVQGG